MVKSILIFAIILIASNVVLSKNVPSGNDLKYIGSFRRTLSVQGSLVQSRSTQLFDESSYYVSQNAGAVNSALADCKRILGANATLLAVESKEEWDFLKEILENYGFATDYWTSGKYDPSKSQWRWSANNVEFNSLAPWGNGFPNKQPNVALGVLIHFGNRYDAYWQTIPNTKLHRYICEVQAPTTAQPCYNVNDLVIVLDSSGSIGSGNFNMAKRFVERLVSAFTVYSQNRVSFVTYSHFADMHIDLTGTLSPAEISSRILSTEYKAGSTATHLGIELATNELLTFSRGVPMNMVILTDGESNSPAMTIDAAKEAIVHGIRTFSVGITPYINQNELLQMAGNDPSRVFTTENFDDLINLLAPLSRKICSS